MNAVFDKAKEFFEELFYDKKKGIAFLAILLALVLIITNTIGGNAKYTLEEMFEKASETTSGSFKLKVTSVQEIDGGSYTQPTYTFSGITNGTQSLISLKHEYNGIENEFNDFMLVTDDAIYMDYQSTVSIMSKVLGYQGINPEENHEKWIKFDTSKTSHDFSELALETKTSTVNSLKTLSENIDLSGGKGNFTIEAKDGAALSEVLHAVALAIDGHKEEWNALITNLTATGNSIISADTETGSVLVDLFNTIIPGDTAELKDTQKAEPESNENIDDSTTSQAEEETSTILDTNTTQPTTESQTETASETKSVTETETTIEAESEKESESSAVIPVAQIDEGTTSKIKSNLSNLKADVALSNLVLNIKRYASSIKEDGGCNMTATVSCTGKKKSPLFSVSVSSRYAIDSGYNNLTVDFTFQKSSKEISLPEEGSLLTVSESKVAFNNILKGLLVIQTNANNKDYEEKYIPSYQISTDNDVVICKINSDMLTEEVVYNTSAGTVYEAIATITSTDKALFSAKVNYYTVKGFTITTGGEFTDNAQKGYAVLKATPEYLNFIKDQAASINELIRLIESQ